MNIKSEANWLLLGNCQVHGLGNCLRLLAPGLEVEAVDEDTYWRNREDINARLATFDRIIAIPTLQKQLPVPPGHRGNIASLPVVLFSGFHPDLCYLAVDGPLARGPLGHYHSAIAYAAFMLGFSVEETLPLYNRDTFARLGYLDAWAQARAWLKQEFESKGFDASARFVAWSRRGQFMHTTNHPRIDVLMDVARMLLEDAGKEIVEPGFLPVDNLLQGPVFPVYPEIATGIGVHGSYRFKPGGSYRLLGLEEFVVASFDSYRAAGDACPSHPGYFAMISGVIACLGGWTDAGMASSDGRGKAPTYRGLFALDLMRRGDFPRCHVFGMHGSGSSVLHSMVERACAAAGIPSINIPDRMYLNGLRHEWQDNADTLDLLEDGRIHLGFRELPPIFRAPSAGLRERRAVLLVQDPRDALASRYLLTGGMRFLSRATEASMLARGEAANPMGMDEYVLVEAGEYLRRLVDYRDSLDFDLVLLRRYEDIHRDKSAFLVEIFDHFGIDVAGSVLDSVVCAGGSEPDDRDMPGFHRARLRPETIERLNDIFRPVAGWYGYDLDARTQ